MGVLIERIGMFYVRVGIAGYLLHNANMATWTF
jgi:hypothetical protein